jgi:5'(3')-deoxyribonucleotidase
MSAETLEFTTATPCEHVIFTELDGREGVLVDLNTRKYYQLNETASFIWRRLEKRSSPQDIANELTDQYEVTLERATLSVTRALKNFRSEKLIQL